jgi:hypothetical protein
MGKISKISQSPINRMFSGFQNPLDAWKYIKSLSNDVDGIRTYRTPYSKPYNMAFPEGC